MIRPLNLVTAFAAGAALMYYLDPQQGRRRRALARDKSVSMGHDVQHYADGKRKQMSDRMKGMAARARAGLSAERIDDEVLHERIRARLGHVVSNPAAVMVAVADGTVRLSGTLPSDEAEELLTRVAAMRGVREVDDRLEADDRNVVDDRASVGDQPLDDLADEMDSQRSDPPRPPQF